MSFSECREQLQQMAKSGVRDSEKVLKYGKPLVEKYSSRLGDEVWGVYEQVFSAALDYYVPNKQLAEKCLAALLKRFGNKSNRVRRLQGMLKEVEGKFQEAESIYDAVLTDDPSNVPVMKRKIALLRGQGKISEAISSLVTFLDTYMSDVEGWKELAELYLSQQMYSMAAHCFEELLLLAPHNHLSHLKYAMTLHTMGGPENLALARSYYCKVLDLNPGNTRALVGLNLVCSALSNTKSNKSGESVNEKLRDFSSQGLSVKFEEAESKIFKATIASLDSLSLASTTS